MADKKNQPSGEDPVEIRKYPNRRFYNTRDSRHVTLEEIRDLVRDGHDIRVTDSRSGADITPAVLTRILLEIESPKLNFFPPSLLQHLIRLNSSFLDSFTESYFHQAFAAFRKSPDQWGAGFVPSMMSPFGGGGMDWSHFWSEAFRQAPIGVKENSTGGKKEGPSESSGVSTMRAELERLREKLDRLENERR